MKKSYLLSALSAIAISFISMSSHAALIGALPATPSSTDWQAVYDDDLSISWVADANLAVSNDFGVTGINVNGTMTWDKANEWIAAMNTANYLGFNDWRLPTTLQPDSSCNSQTGSPPQGFGTGCTGSEMGHLYNIEGVSSSSPNLFSNVQSEYYWSGTSFALDAASAWGFDFSGSIDDQATGTKDTFLFNAWAVRDGDVSAIPVPAAVWLFGSGLLGLTGIARRKKM